MATVLFVWEWGGGLGHLMQLSPLAVGLARRGHRIFAALKDLSRARSVLGTTPVAYLQAPVKTRPTGAPPRLQVTFAQIMQSMGFDDAEELGTMADAWRHLFQFVKPDLIVFDHSPIAMLAARTCPARRIVIGSGFCVPPDVHPMPSLRPWLKVQGETFVADEQRVLERMNGVLAAWRQPPLQRVTQIYSEVDETLLLTFEELDHYPCRPNAHYWGAWTYSTGKTAEWPAGSGGRIYAYLKSFAALPDLLGLLARLRRPTIVVSDGIQPAVQRRFASALLRFENQALDLNRAARECQLAILNAGHGTTVTMLMAGKPILQVPIYLEQGLMANAISNRLGAGLQASYKNAREVEERLQAMLESKRYAAAAQAFANKYASFDPETQEQSMLRRVEEVIHA